MSCSPLFDSNVPQALLDLEKWVSRHVREPLHEVGAWNLPVYSQETETDIEKFISPGVHLSATQSIGIYNQQYWFRFFKLAHENFPSLVRLFGSSDFNQLIVEPAILKYPPDNWAIFETTAHIPRWIDEFYEEGDKSLILAMAQIDAIYHRLPYVAPLPNAHFGPLIRLQPFVAFLELEGDLLSFRNELLSQEPEYWLKNEFPSIDFSRNYFFSFHQKKEALLIQEISEEEFRHLKNCEKGFLDKIPKEWFQKWLKERWIRPEMIEKTPY